MGETHFPDHAQRAPEHGGRRAVAGRTPSVAPQNLSNDALLLKAPRTMVEGRERPVLGGIPLLAKIGQGGMGAVYYGVHPQLQVEVAVKVLPFQIAVQRPEMIKRFVGEARMAGKINSANLIYVRDVGEDHGIFYQVMEYVCGVSAGALLREVKAAGRVGLTELDALDICIAAATGLAAAHAKGVVHRDIKPDNILIPQPPGADAPEYASAKLADLGLARTENLGPPSTGTETAMGTAGFVPLEQAKDMKSAGRPSDVFSLGATLYALLAGHAPFRGAGVKEIMLETQLDRKQAIQVVRPDVSNASAALLDRCLARDAAARYADGAELLAALQHCRAKRAAAVQECLVALAGESAVAAPPGLSPSGRRVQSQRFEARAFASGVAKFVLAGAATRKGLYLVAGLLLLSLIALAVTLAVGRPSGSPRDPEDRPTDTGPLADARGSEAVILPKERGLDLGGGVKMECVLVPAGQFLMGSDKGELDEQPPHRVKISQPFYIGKHEVTAGQFRRFADATKHQTDAEKSGKGWTVKDGAWQQAEGSDWRKPGFPQADDCPVVLVSWNDAAAFCKWLNEQPAVAALDKQACRLPTEAEWEYAARGAQNFVYPWGKEWDGAQANHLDLSMRNSKLGDPKWFYGSEDDSHVFTAPAGRSKNASWCGAANMVGNAAEWVQDRYEPAYYAFSPLADPKGANNGIRVYRGGSWFDIPERCYAARRSNAAPDYFSATLGFRVVLAAAKETER